MEAERGYSLFETPIGRCGIAWGRSGIAGVQLPETDAAATRERLARRFPDAAEGPPPRAVRRAIEAIRALLRGERVDLSAIELDMQGLPPFPRRVYEAARAIAPGSTLSYGELAARIGSPGAARAVGQALGRNPFAIVVPCHRVLAANGRIGGFSADGGVGTKRRMLAIEGVAGEASPGSAAPLRGLGFDPRRAVAHLRASDPGLARLVDAVGPFRLELRRTSSVYGALVEAIVHQQLGNKAAETIHGRLCALFPRSRQGPTPRDVLRATDARLRGAGLSRAKAAALRDLARRTTSGEIPELAELRTLEDEEIVERLTRVRGIGRWTVEMLLIFRLGRPDVLPADDYGLRKGFALAFRKRKLPRRAELERRAEPWRPYRSVASWYLWRALDRAGT
jgi:methylated-DNA-[protein]-cysteine S-methyltransferase